MERDILKDLKAWKGEKLPLVVIFRGARQIGKTYSIEDFAKSNFKNWCKINFEKEPEYRKLFNNQTKIADILETISIQKNIDIVAGETLIFLDEIQECPAAIQALRYFYEDVPGLHVIAAGSLLEFALDTKEFKFPVGRVSFLYMYPMSFYEFLMACGKERLIQYLQKLSLKTITDDVMHQTLLSELRKYFLVGGMPYAVKHYIKHMEEIDGGLKEAFKVHDAIVQAYKSDFGKYAKTSQHDDLEAVMNYIPQIIGHKFKYSKVYPEASSQKIKSAFDLLNKAGVIHKISKTSPSIPLGAGVSTKHFKAIMLDIGLLLSLYDSEDLLVGDFWDNISGSLAEQFVGQELITLRAKHKKAQLYYWERDSHQSSAEIDYLVNYHGQVIPIEVKAGISGKLKSLRLFMGTYKCPLGIRISSRKLEKEGDLLSVPLYAIAEVKRLWEEAAKL